MKGVFLLEKCSCYHPRLENIYPPHKNRITQRIIGYCWGTKECEPCSCNGDKLKCDFYDYIRERAEKERLEYKIKEAIELLEKNGYRVENDL